MSQAVLAAAPVTVDPITVEVIGIIPHILKRHPVSAMRPGDVFVGNNAYEGGGTHLPDIVLAEPVFFDGDLPKLKAVDVVVYADETARVAALQTGDVDLIEYVPWQSIPSIEADPNLKLDATNGNDPAGLLDSSLGPSASRSYDVRLPKLEQLFAAGRAEFDEDKRRAIYRDLQREAVDSVPAAFLAWRSQGYAMSRNVQGFASMPGALTFFSGMTLEETNFN